MVPSGKYHSPTFAPSAFLQHKVLTLLVTHTRERPESVAALVPTSVMWIVLPGRITVPFRRKYKPELGAEKWKDLH